MRSRAFIWRCIVITALLSCTITVSQLYLHWLPSSIFLQTDLDDLQRCGYVAAERARDTVTPTLRQGSSEYQTNIRSSELPVSEHSHDMAVSKASVAPSGHQDLRISIKNPGWLKVVNIGEFMKAEKALLLGKRRSEKGVLTIGVPTVYRPKKNYLMETLSGLIVNLSPEEMRQVSIVVFVADFNVSYRNTVVENVKNAFSQELQDGLVQVIVAPREFYPDMQNLPLLYGDDSDRVRWRSKQALDYSFMYFYCADLSKYYIQLEDDVLVEKGYLQYIKDFISASDDGWSTLEFGARGFIGMLYRGEHLLSLARFSRMYFWTMPIDWIFRVYNDIFLKGNSDHYIRKPPIFKHVGAFSTLEGQTRKLEDLEDDAVKEETVPPQFQKVTNPAAHVSTTMEDYVASNSIENAYKIRGFFWGKTVRVDDSIDILLTDAVALNRVVFSSGSKMYPEDSFQDTELLVSPETQGRCTSYRSVRTSVDASVVDVTLAGEIDFPVKCIRLVIMTVRLDNKGKTRWLLVSEISVFPRN